MLRSAAAARKAAPRLVHRRLQSSLPPAPPPNAVGAVPPPLPPPPAAAAPPLPPPSPAYVKPIAPGPHPAEPQPSSTVPPAEPVRPSGPGVASRLRSLLVSSALFLGTGALLFYAYDTRAGVHRWFTTPAFLALTENDPEKGHNLAVKVLATGLGPVDCGVDDERLAFELWGKKFSNPIGIAAGFDKHAEAIDGLFNLGFGYVEVGSVTPVPQPGNPKPRVFRVPESDSVVNRYGFNSEGHTTAVARLRSRVRQFVHSYASLLPAELFSSLPPSSTGEIDPVEQYLASPASTAAAPADAIGYPRSLKQGKVLGLNLGKNKVSDPDSIDDFVKGIAALGPYADVVVVNVSSPNTPGLRNLQRKGMLSELLEGVVQARDLLPTTIKPPVLVKVAPDLDDEQISDIAYAAKNSGIDGVIVSNTTISRPASAGSSPVLKETGGLSGPPVKPLAIRALSALYEQTDGKIPLVGCGGISSGQDALDYAKAGASLVQLYTGFVYGGVGLPRQIKDELAELLRKEGKSWLEVVGSGRVKKPVPQEARAVKDKADGLSEKPTPEAFSKSVQEAKGELEELLKELAEVEKPVSPSAAPSPASAGATLAATADTKTSSSSVPPIVATAPAVEPVAVPAPVAESIPPTPAAVSPLTTPASSSDATLSPATSTSTPTPASSASPAAPSTPPVPRIVLSAPAPKLEEQPVAAPAPALLNPSAIAELLDPAAAQIKAGIEPVGKVELEEQRQEKVDEKRWV
ncbi:hypothetical protein JCM11251_003811 [Rhodosporidiobolus azoricus]